MKPLTLVSHLTAEELEAAYRQSNRPIERTRWQILWLKAKGKSTAEIAEVTGYRHASITTIIRRYNHTGSAAVRDGRQDNRSDPALNLAQQQQLSQALLGEPPMGGLWTSGKVQVYVRTEFGLEITPPCAWGYFKRLGFSVQVPRPRHHQAASPQEQHAFKKSRSDTANRAGGVPAFAGTPVRPG